MASRIPPPPPGGDEAQGALFHLEFFLPGDEGQMAVDLLAGQPFEIKPLAAGEDGRRELMTFRSGKDKDDMGRRLLQGLQEGIEGFRRQHMRFINDVYLVIPFHRGQTSPVP